MNVAFPSLALRKQKRDEETKKVLKWWTERGPMKVTPLAPLTLKSKLKSKIVQVTRDEGASKLYEGLGDAMGRAWGSRNQKGPSTYAPIAGVRR